MWAICAEIRVKQNQKLVWSESDDGGILEDWNKWSLHCKEIGFNSVTKYKTLEGIVEFLSGFQSLDATDSKIWYEVSHRKM